ncbi:hypothetical protein pEaSNUABM10_00127 [Erwinia phage pEa_SNUABM_10]|nr:hypothetical protein pEaSNUABM10_00127 [Erwinia phage pEa_SNUABM_10]
MYNYVVLNRKGSVITFVFKSDPPAKARALDLAGFDYKGIRKGVQLSFDGEVQPENLLYSGDVEPRKLTKMESKSASKAMPIFEVLKRVGTSIQYRIVGSEHGIELKLDLAGYDYKKLKKGVNFQFDGGIVSADNLRIVNRGNSDKIPLAKVAAPVTKQRTAVKSKRGATPNVSILRKHF